MGRRKLYDRDEVLGRAMEVFWADGFHGTSTRRLSDEMGISVASMYAEFGSKDDLYADAVRRYEEQIVTAFFGPLEAPDATVQTVREVLRQFPAMARQVDNPPGCLVTNAVVDRAPDAAFSEAVMARYVARISAGIERALTNSLSTTAGPMVQTRALAHHLVAVLIGLFVLARARTDHGMLDDVVAAAIAELDAFTAEHGLDEPRT